MPARPSHGFSLIELTLVLSIVGVTLGALWMIVDTNRGNMQAATIIKQTLQINSSVRTYFATRKMPTGVAGETDAATFTCTLQDKKVFPEDTCSGSCAVCATPVSTSRPVNSYSGTILTSVVNTSPYTQYTISHAYVEVKGCAALMTETSLRAAELGLVSVQANSATARTTFPVSPDAAIQDCSNATNTVNLVFKIRN